MEKLLGEGNCLRSWAVFCVVLTEPGMEGVSEMRMFRYLLGDTEEEISVFVDVSR